MALGHLSISLVFSVAAATWTGSMIVVLGIGLALAAAIACAGYFAFRPSPRRSSAPTQKSAPPQDAPPAEASADFADAAEPDTTATDPPPGETSNSPHPRLRPADPPRAGIGPFADTRRHPRTIFLGTAAATIYPPDSRQNSEPKQCIVDTRDLSCNGIGIGHTEQLYPTQMIVLKTLGKLLLAEIRWCHRIDNHYYIAGCRLLRTDT